MSEASPSVESYELQVPAMDCPSCAKTVATSVRRLEGIERVESQVTTGRLVVDYDPAKSDPSAIRERVRAGGYEPASAVSERTFAVPDMDCAGCAKTVEHALGEVADVTAVGARPTAGQVTVSAPPAVTDDALLGALEDAGYTATPLEDGGRRLGSAQPIWRRRRAVGTGVGAAFVAIGLALEFVVPGSNPVLASPLGREYAASHVVFVLAAAVAGTPILSSGSTAARARSLDIDVLMSIGIVASVAAHHPKEGALLAVLFSIAQLLERASMDRARDSLRELMALAPEMATIRHDDGTEETIPAAELTTDDRVMVRPGEKIPADGTVVDGSSAVDQSPITGESVPADKTPGDEVYAGTILESGSLEVTVDRPADESTIARIVELVADAEREQTDREQFVDRFARVYTPVVVIAAVVLAVAPPLLAGGAWNTWFLRGLTLLVIACPCALVISTPVSVVSGITSAARNGVLIKGGPQLEALDDIAVVAIDKTGTLTTGELQVTDIVPLEDASEREVLARAAALEYRSEHPIGRAIVETARERGIDPATTDVTAFDALPGTGVRGDLAGETHYVGKPGLFDGLADLSHVDTTTDGGATGSGVAHEGCDEPGCVDALADLVPPLERAGKTVVIVGTAARPLGVVAVADSVRPEAAWAVGRLQAEGARVVMLTGDNRGTARAIANQVGIEEFHAELLPDEKLERIRSLDAEADGGVAMVGDGINDAPALATASVGVAMGAAGTDTALESADVALLGDDLSRLPYLSALSGRANGVIRQNIWGSLAVKALLAAGAPFGIVTVIHAVVIGDMGMSLGVTGNAMRLAGVEPDRPPSEKSGG